MKKYIYIIIALIVFNSCNESKRTNNKVDKSSTKSHLELKAENLNLERNSDSILTKWVDYYKEKKPSFSLSDFDLETTNSLGIMPGNVFGNFDENFDPIYKDFLIFNSDDQKY